MNPSADASHGTDFSILHISKYWWLKRLGKLSEGQLSNCWLSIWLTNWSPDYYMIITLCEDISRYLHHIKGYKAKHQNDEHNDNNS